MLHTHKVILSAIAIAASFGAVQFASGEDLTVGMRTAGMPDQGVNRANKTDRAPISAEPAGPTQTVGFHVDRLPDTSILVRIAVTHEAPPSAAAPAALPLRSSAPAPLRLNSERKLTVACEPVVSVLTEIAKRLQPGRCVT